MQTYEGIVDRYFLEHRAKVLDIAAYLDRLDRYRGASAEDFRERALRDAIGELRSAQPGRVRRVLERLSDQTSEPIDRAGERGACGAPRDRAGSAG